MQCRIRFWENKKKNWLTFHIHPLSEKATDVQLLVKSC